MQGICNRIRGLKGRFWRNSNTATAEKLRKMNNVQEKRKFGQPETEDSIVEDKVGFQVATWNGLVSIIKIPSF